MIFIRNKNNYFLWTLLFIGFAGTFTNAQQKPASKIKSEMVLVKGGNYKPLYADTNAADVKVESFYMDKYAVTNSDFQKFVEENPKWRKSKVKKIFADKTYLTNWESDLKPGKNVLPNAPVTNVSWFAAKDYCECQGKRLPKVAEWEYAAQASETKANGGSDKKYLQKIFDWYSMPTQSKISRVGSKGKNYWGVYDLHGLIWEWTQDFYSALVTGESRGDSGLEKNLFCGSGSVGAADFTNYPAFLRFAFRSSLKANYTTANLGFRCVKDYKNKRGVK